MTKPGHEAPHFDYAAKPESDQLRIETEAPREPETMISGEEEKTEVAAERQIDSRVPAAVRTKLEQEFEEADSEWDRRDTNYPRTMAQNRRDVGGPLLTGDDIERAARVKPTTSRRPKKDRRHLGSRGKIIADDTPESVRERTSNINESLPDVDPEISRAAAEAAKRALGFDK